MPAQLFLLTQSKLRGRSLHERKAYDFGHCTLQKLVNEVIRGEKRTFKEQRSVESLGRSFDGHRRHDRRWYFCPNWTNRRTRRNVVSSGLSCRCGHRGVQRIQLHKDGPEIPLCRRDCHVPQESLRAWSYDRGLCTADVF